jgi:hypothetical protein
MFPSGTTDGFDEKNEKTQLAPFSKGTKVLIKMILRNTKNSLHFIGVNDRKTMPTPNTFEREDVYVKMMGKFLNSLSPNEIDQILQTLTEYVI